MHDGGGSAGHAAVRARARPRTTAVASRALYAELVARSTVPDARARHRTRTVVRARCATARVPAAPADRPAAGSARSAAAAASRRPDRGRTSRDGGGASAASVARSGAIPAATAAIIAAPIGAVSAARRDVVRQRRARRRGSGAHTRLRAPPPSSRTSRAGRPSAPSRSTTSRAREREPLEHGARDVRAIVAGGEAVQRAARVRPPHRRHRAGERGDERDAAGAGRRRGGERIELGVARRGRAAGAPSAPRRPTASPGSR